MSNANPEAPAEPMPAPERHDTYGGHDAIWLVTSCGQEGHPLWWSCSVCAERPTTEGGA